MTLFTLVHLSATNLGVYTNYYVYEVTDELGAAAVVLAYTSSGISGICRMQGMWQRRHCFSLIVAPNR